jgi:ribose transport system substrate-binding protein
VTSFEGQNDVQKEAAAVLQCIADGYEVIFINPSDIQGIVPSLMEAKEAGLIIGMFSSQPPEDATWYDFFCGCDDTLAGQRGAQAFLAAFPDGAKVVEVGGQAGHDAQIKRRDGFREGIEGSGIVVLDSQNCNGWVTADAMAIAEDFITKYGDEIDGVFCHWDNGATGVIEEL